MPQNKFQNFIFTLMMTTIMTYSMIVYSIATNSPEELINNTFLEALKEFPLEEVIIFICAFFIAGTIAKKVAFRFVNPSKDSKMFVILSIQSMTVLLMVGLMSLYALFARYLVNSNVVCNYITLYCKGPLVRNIFRIIFKKQLKNN